MGPKGDPLQAAGAQVIYRPDPLSAPVSQYDKLQDRLLEHLLQVLKYNSRALPSTIDPQSSLLRINVLYNVNRVLWSLCTTSGLVKRLWQSYSAGTTHTQ